MPNFRPRLPFALILIAALAVRSLAAFWWESRLPAGKKFFFGDSESYWDLAADLAAGREYAYGRCTMFRTPGYPLLLSPLFLLVGDEPPTLLARVWNAVWGTATVGGVMILAWQLFGRTTALVAGCIAALNPEAIGASVFILSEAPFGPFLLGQLIFAIQASQARTTNQLLGYAAAAGFCGGMATLIRPSWLLFTPFLLGATWLIFRDRWRWLRLNSIQVVGLCCAMLPWWGRNFYLSGEFVPTSTEVGISLLDGWNEAANGSSNFQVPAIQKWRNQLQESDADYFDAERSLKRELAINRLAAADARAWAAEHPLRVVQLAGIKFNRMWNLWPNENEFRSLPMRLLVAGTYLPVIFAAFFGLRRGIRHWPCWLLLLPAVYFTLLHVVFVSSIRYRLPALLPLMVIAAAELVRWWGRERLDSGAAASSSAWPLFDLHTPTFSLRER